MEPAAPASCASCHKPESEVPKLIAVGDALLCESCLDSGAALDQAMSPPPPPPRDPGSTLLDAEAMALDLIDALESSRAEQAERELAAENEPRSKGLLRLVQAEAALDSPREEPAASATPTEARGEAASEPEPIGDDEVFAEESFDEAEEVEEPAAPAERKIPLLRFCPRCTGRLDGITTDGETPLGVTRYSCESCSGKFEIREL
jgi:hypothetical protein